MNNMNIKFWSALGIFLLATSPSFSDGMESSSQKSELKNSNFNLEINYNSKDNQYDYVPNHDLQLSAIEYYGKTIVPSMALDYLILDFLPHHGTLSAVLIDRKSGRTLESQLGNYVGESKLSSDKKYAFSEIDGINVGYDEISVDDTDYLRFILNEDELWKQLGDGRHSLALIEYTTYGAKRGTQEKMGSITLPGEYENSVSERRYIDLEFKDGELTFLYY